MNSGPSGMDGLTWLEKMELLRSVNRRKEKPKLKQPKLTYVKDMPPDVSTNTKKSTIRKASPTPDNLTSLAAQSQTNSQLFEQRRIKHLLQQARMKRNSQFDWLTESPRFRYSLNSSKDDSSDDSSICDHEQEETRSKSPKCFSPGMDVGHAESTLLSRYNIKPFVKGGGWKVTPMTMQRARTIIYDD